MQMVNIRKVNKMKKYFKIISVILLVLFLVTPSAVKAEPGDGEQPLTIDSFVINSNENEKYNATLKATAATEIYYQYTVAVVTDISQEGKEVASGSGRTGEDVSVDINMSNINTYDSYRFKITVTYSVEENEYIAYAYSKEFDYTQETYAEDLGGRDIVVDMTAKILKINWINYTNWSAESVLVTIEADGEKVVEEVVEKNKEGYDYYFDQDTKQVTVTLKQVFDGKLSKGITDTIDIVKADNTDDFYLEFPSEEEQYGSVWNVKYFNGTENKVTWKADSAKKDLELDGDGSFLIDMGENNESLIVNYTDANNISWKYEFDTEIIIYAPTIKLLEEYDGSRVKSSSLVLSGKVDDASAMVKINGREVEVDKNGMFTDMVTLETGKNVINLEASNKVGKTSRTSVTVYKEGSSSSSDDGGILGEYTTLIITAGVSIILLAVLIAVSRIDRSKTNEKEN